MSPLCTFSYCLLLLLLRVTIVPFVHWYMPVIARAPLLPFLSLSKYKESFGLALSARLNVGSQVLLRILGASGRNSACANTAQIRYVTICCHALVLWSLRLE